jgi:hypothetical protein
MWVKYIILTILFFILALAQASFFPYFNILGIVPNFVFILFISLLFFCRQDKVFLIFTSIIAGFFLDVFSNLFFGSFIISFFIIYIFAGRFLKNLIETKERFPFLHFAFFFILAYAFNKLFLSIINFVSYHQYSESLSWIILVEIAYNLLFATIGFYVFKKLQNKK